ncbi:MAG: Bug family tripartite tricarboxylate transporter substrate binding protein [Burkholderiaceae bacterium]
MTHPTRTGRRSLCAGLAAAPLLYAAGVSAQSARRMVIPYTPGGSTDQLGRLFADALGAQLNDKFVVENKPGANGTLGAQQVAVAPGDGRTLCYTFGNLLLNQQHMMKNPGVNPITDMVPITRTSVIQAVFVASVESPYKHLGELIEAARRNPGKVSYAYYGDLASASVGALANVELNRISYKGGVPGMMDVAGGRVDFIYSSLAQSGPMIRSGKLKALAVSGDQRLSEFPNVPTASELLPKYRAVDYQVVLAPKGTPAAVVEELYTKSVAALRGEDIRRQFLEKGSVVAPMRPDELLTFMREDLAQIGEACKAAGIKPE